MDKTARLSLMKSYFYDGTLMVALLHFKTVETAAKMGGSMELGLNHFGFWVEDLAETRRRLRELEAENTRLRKAVADLTLEKLILKEAASGNW